ncbi:MAG: hypothetical protein GF398_21950 [Chitinivibrionales bacterium]|nr:hypothetical protein [Chitinivibrionales bacterium]
MPHTKNILAKIFCSAIAACMLAQCTGSQITVENNSSSDVTFHFKGQTFEIDARGGRAEISDIPNGTYTYNTVYAIPAGVSLDDVTEGDGLSGNIDLFNHNTFISILYISALSVDADTTGETKTVYEIDASVSSNYSSVLGTD